MLPITFNGFFPLLLTFGGIQGIIMAVLLLVREHRKYSSRMIAIFLLSYALPTLNFALINSSIGGALPSRVILQPFILLFGPSFYFFLKSLFGDNVRSADYFIHAIPFFTLFLYEISLAVDLLEIPIGLHWTTMISSVFYAILVLNYCRREPDRMVLISKHGYARLMLFCYVLYALFSVSFLILLFLRIENRLAFIYSIGAAMTVLVYCMGFITYWKSTRPTKKLDQELGTQVIQKIRTGLDQLVAEKFYLQSDIQLQDIAARLDTSQRYVSRFINEEKNSSYTDFVNKLRIDEAKRILLASKDNPKMLAVALDSGFSNKVTFNKHFKKYTGQTPKQFQYHLTK